jgi:hypothetical protein
MWHVNIGPEMIVTALHLGASGFENVAARVPRPCGQRRFGLTTHRPAEGYYRQENGSPAPVFSQEHHLQQGDRTELRDQLAVNEWSLQRRGSGWCRAG